MTITDRMAAWRRGRRVLQRVSRAAWRLEQAERERAWALASARAEGVSIRPDRRTGRRRRAAGPDLDFREFCRRGKLPRSGRSWDLSAAERYRRGETDVPASEAYNPFRHHQQGPYA